MTHFLATAIAAALQQFEEMLTHIPKTDTKKKGHTTRTESAPVTFEGVLMIASQYRRTFSDGGVDSHTKRILIVYPTTVDSNGVVLSIEINDGVQGSDGVQFFVHEILNEENRLGTIVYKLGEERI